MKFDFDTVIPRRNTNSIKYDFAEKFGKPADVLPMWVADMDFQTPPAVRDALAARAGHGIFGYSEPDKSYFDALADGLAEKIAFALRLGEQIGGLFDFFEIEVFLQRLFFHLVELGLQELDVPLAVLPEQFFLLPDGLQRLPQDRRSLEQTGEHGNHGVFQIASGNALHRAVVIGILVQARTDVVAVFPALLFRVGRRQSAVAVAADDVPVEWMEMPLRDRAAQLAPFAALTGYEATVGETARLTAERCELDPQEAEELNRRLTERAARLKDRPEVTIEYFVPDERKAGGAYVTVTDVVRNISIAERIVALVNGDVIPINDIAVAYVVRQGSRFVKLLNGSLRTVR